MRRSRRVAAALALVWVAAVPGLPSHAAGPCTATSDAGGGWLAARPTFTAGPAEVTLAVSPAFAPDLLYATNGTVIARSEDAGCTWAPAFAASSAQGPAGTARITALTAPSSANSSAFVYAGVTVELADGVALPKVVASKDRGRNWVVSTAAGGLPLTGDVQAVTANPLVPQTAYAVVGLGPGDLRSSVYATSDAGTSWTERTATGGTYTGGQLTANPLTQTELFAVDGGEVVVSDDGAATFRRTEGDSGSVGGFSLASGGGGTRLAAGRLDSRAVARSDDRGASWRAVPVPVRPTAVAMAPLRDLVAVSDGAAAYLVGDFGTLDVSPSGGAPLQLVVSAPTASGFSVTGVRTGQVLRLVVTAGATPSVVAPRADLRPVTLLPPGVLDQFPSLLLPATLRVALPAGASTQRPYRLVVPRTPTPVDLMFLIDTTGSMGGVINGLRQDLARIVDVLGTAGLQARFGVAEFRDYGTPGDGYEYPYRLRRTIGPSDASLRAALNALQAGGGGDGPESSLTALLQSSSGVGQRPFVEPGGQAGYRPQAFKLALIAADTEFHRAGDSYSGTPGTETWPGPGFDETVAALRRAGVHQIGLAASQAPISDMKQMATMTGALAPAGGVDCDADGQVDVPGAGPLVCELQSDVTAAPVAGTPSEGGGTALAGAVVAVANGITDDQPVRLAVTRGEAVARVVAGRSSASPVTVLNLKADNELSYLLELHCPGTGSSTHTVELSATTTTGTLTGATLQLDCTSVPGGPALTEPAAQVVAVAQAVAPGPPQPVQQPAPNPNPNLNPAANANPNVNPQVGAAGQHESNAELAYATDDGQGSERLAMSARDAGFLGTAGLMLTVATGVAVRRRAQVSCS